MAVKGVPPLPIELLDEADWRLPLRHSLAVEDMKVSRMSAFQLDWEPFGWCKCCFCCCWWSANAWTKLEMCAAIFCKGIWINWLFYWIRLPWYWPTTSRDDQNGQWPTAFAGIGRPDGGTVRSAPNPEPHLTTAPCPCSARACAAPRRWWPSAWHIPLRSAKVAPVMVAVSQKFSEKMPKKYQCVKPVGTNVVQAPSQNFRALAQWKQQIQGRLLLNEETIGQQNLIWPMGKCTLTCDGEDREWHCRATEQCQLKNFWKLAFFTFFPNHFAFFYQFS